MSSSQTSSVRRGGRRLARWMTVAVIASVIGTLRERAFARNRERFPLVVPAASAGDPTE